MRRVAWARLVDRHVGSVLIKLLSALRLPRAHGNPDQSKALLIKFAGMGDIILLKPVVDCIVRHRSHMKLHFLTSPDEREVVAYLGLASGGAIHEFDFGKCLSRPCEFLRQMLALRKKRFCAAVDFEQWMRASAIISFLSSAPRRFGFSTPGQLRDGLFTDCVNYSFSEHTLKSFSRLASRFIETDIVEEAQRIFVGCVHPLPQEVEAMMRRLRSFGWRGKSHPIAVIHPGCGAGGEPRMWAIERYAEVARRLSKEGIFVALTGGVDDAQIAKRLMGMVGDGVANLVGKTSFAELVALVSMAKFVLCPNTGIMHLAAALGITTIALHGPTNPAQWCPIGDGHVIIKAKLNCVPCLRLGHDYKCDDYKCMRTITVDEVWQAIEHVLKGAG